MEQKKAYEQYRVASFASPHPAHSAAAASQAHTSAADGAGAEAIQPDTQRVILHFDVDCFYAQVEEVRAPHLRGVPMGVTQKYLIVTCNYPARAAGVTKLMGITEAQQRCPGIVLIPGEDLSPYRAASKSILSVLSRFGPAEKLGMDETFVDVTREVEARIASGQAAGAAAAVAAGATATCSAAVSASPAAAALGAHPAAAAAAAADVPCSSGSTDPAGNPQRSNGGINTAATTSGRNSSGSGSSGGWGYGWKGHVHLVGCSVLGSASRHRPQDLRVVPSTAVQPPSAAAPPQASISSEAGNGFPSAAATTSAAGCQGGTAGASPDHLLPSTSVAPQPDLAPARSLAQAAAETAPEVLLRLMVGSWIAAEARAAVAAEAGFRCSAGVACNKMLAKLVSGLHKPNDQTVMLPSEAAAFVAPLPARALPGVGFKTDGRLRGLGVETAGQLRALGRAVLCEEFGAKLGPHLWDLCRGRDATPVLPSGPPKSITVEDSFKSCSSWEGVGRVLGVLVPDLLARLGEEWAEHRRSPATLTLKWRHRGTGWTRSSASCQLPLASAASLTTPPSPDHVALVTNAALKVLRQHLPPSFNLSLLNVGATGFKEAPAAGAMRGVAALLQARSVKGLTKSTAGVDRPVAAAGGSTSGAAAAHLEARRDYDAAVTAAAGSVGGGGGSSSRAAGAGGGGSSAGLVPAGGWMSKSRERQLREQQLQHSAQHQHQQQQEQPEQEQDHWKQQQQQQQQQWQQPAVPQQDALAVGRKRSPTAPLSQLETVLAVKRSKTDPWTSTRQLPAVNSVNAGPTIAGGSGADRGPCVYTSPAATATAAAAAVAVAVGDTLTTCTEAAAVCQPSVGTCIEAARGVPDPTLSAAESVPAAAATLGIGPSPSSEGVAEGGSQWGSEPGPAYNAAHVGGGWGVVSWEVTEGWEEEEEQEEQEPQPPLQPQQQEDLWQLWQQQQQQEEEEKEEEGSEQQQTQQQQQQEQQQEQQVGSGPISTAVVTGVTAAGVTTSPVDWDLLVPDSEDWDAECGGEQQQQQQQQEHEAAAPAPHTSPLPAQGSSEEVMQGQQGNQLAPSASAAGVDPPAPIHNASINGGSSEVRRVVLHIDVDCYYCQVERLDDPSLVGVPLAVTQFNAGGFVAVSYEARAAGIKCGDGVGDGGRAALPHLQKIGAVSLQEALRKCPGLVVRPMRTDRYRQVASQLHTLLARFSPGGVVEKASYDDFYIDISAWCCGGAAAGGQPGQTTGQRPGQPAAAGGAPEWLESTMQQWAAAAGGGSSSSSGAPSHGEVPGLDRVFVQLAGAAAAAQVTPGDGSDSSDVHAGPSSGASTGVDVKVPDGWDLVEPALQRGTAVAQQLRHVVKQQMGLTVSCGIAPGKLLARLVGPQNKPDAVTVLPAACSVSWMGQQQLRAIPYLRGKAGQAVVASLGVDTVQQLSALGLSQQQLTAQFGAATGALLHWLPLGRSGSSSPVRERGPPKSLMVERSFPPLTRPAAIKEALTPLVNTLWVRLLDTTAAHGRLPVKLGLTWRQGYGAPRTASAAAPTQLSTLLRPLLQAGTLGRDLLTSDASPGATGEEAAGESPYNALLSPGAQHMGTRAMLESYLGIFRGAAGAMGGNRGGGGLQVTRLAVSVMYGGEAAGSGGGAAGAAGGAAARGRLRQLEGQQTLQGFRKSQ